MIFVMLAVTVSGVLFASWMGIALCRDEDQGTGLYCAGTTLGVQIILAMVFRNVWERNPYLCLVVVMAHQCLCFLPVMMTHQRESTGRRFYPAIVASVISGIFTLATWLFIADQASKPHI